MRNLSQNITFLRLITLLIFVIFGVLFFLLLPACDIKLLNRYLSGYCPKGTANLEETNQNIDEFSLLNRKIAELEMTLLNKECLFSERSQVSTQPPLSDAPAGVDRVEKSLTENEIKAWENNDISFLVDCWTLEGSELIFRNEETNERSKSNAMKICFDQGGVGEIELSLNDAPCRGKSEASFDENDDLVLKDTEDIICDSGKKIFKRVTTCQIDDQSVARCTSYQPRSGGQNEFILVKE